MCETDIDGDAAALLFFQAVGVNAGQRLDQRGLAMVDVPGGANDAPISLSMMILAAEASISLVHLRFAGG